MPSYQQLEAIFQRLSHLQHLAAIGSWDEAVMMPSGGGESRAKALATLSTIIHETTIGPKVGELIEQAKQESLQSEWQQANLKWIEKQYLNATCLPSDLVTRKTQASIQCEQAWRTLRAENNWQAFAPLLEEVVNLVKQSANIRADVFNMNAYDVLLDDFSPGVSQQYIDPIFAELKTFIPEFLPKVIEKQNTLPMQDISGEFPIDQQKALGIELMRAIGFDFNYGRLDVSHHPFCGGVAEDVRITTRYNHNEFISAMMGVCHETGHALYERGLPREWLEQPVGQALGMSVHESQSLLVEMQACRSLPFMHFVTPLVKKHFGDNKAFTPENLYYHYTKVEPGFIRVDADEVTYPLHVIIRYEIEKQLISGEITVKDLPEVWNDYMTNFLGLSTKNNFKDGVMQDVHWPSGAFGYFPAYTLGALIAAQLFNSAEQAKPQIRDELSQGNFATLIEWLRKNIHSQASLHTMDTLITNASGKPLSADDFITHLNKRYLDK